MKTKWDDCRPNIEKDKETGNITDVIHNHARTIDYSDYSILERAELRQVIDQRITELAGCIAFFKACVADKEITGTNRAIVESALAEDERRLEEFQSHKPCCTIL